VRPSDELWQAELDFVARTQERGAEGWTESFAEDGVQLVPGASPIRGRAAILERASNGLPDDFTWEPLCAMVSNDETLGFTYGTWKAPGATGMYTSIWRRDDEGRWVVAVDGGFADPEPFSRDGDR
jgi:ketosteroid isomerase-like protein